MLEGLPLQLTPDTVGVLALSLPFVALVLVNLIKNLFYWRAPLKWQVWLPDKYWWPALAGLICIVGCLLFKIDIGGVVLGDKWPVLPFPLDEVSSGIILAAVSAKILYPLTVSPAKKAAARAAVQAHIAANPCPPVDAPVDTPEQTLAQFAPSSPEPVAAAPSAQPAPVEPSPVPVVPEVVPESSPANPAVVPVVPAPVPTARLFLELHGGSGPDRFVLVEEDGEQHIYPVAK